MMNFRNILCIANSLYLNIKLENLFNSLIKKKARFSSLEQLILNTTIFIFFHFFFLSLCNKIRIFCFLWFQSSVELSTENPYRRNSVGWSRS